MKRKNKKSPDAILTADWHVRGDRPVCRTDNYMEAQEQKIKFILSLANKYGCPILEAGDFGHKPMWGDKLLNWTTDIIRSEIRDNVEILVIPGQHDLLNHRLDNIKEGGIGVLHKNGSINILNSPRLSYNKFNLYTFPYSTKMKNIEPCSESRNVAIAHQMVIKTQKDKLWPDQQAHSGKWFLKKYPCYDLIISGDNHQSFVVEHEGRLLVNPGSMMRMSANQIDHKPSVYLWYAEDNTVERVYLPIEKGVISREHIEEGQQRDKRIESFVNRLKDVEELGLSFEKNMEEFLETNKVKKTIREKIWESME